MRSWLVPHRCCKLWFVSMKEDKVKTFLPLGCSEAQYNDRQIQLKERRAIFMLWQVL